MHTYIHNIYIHTQTHTHTYIYIYRFDHHCTFMNTCIGKKNYWYFFTCCLMFQLLCYLQCAFCILLTSNTHLLYDILNCFWFKFYTIANTNTYNNNSNNNNNNDSFININNKNINTYTYNNNNFAISITELRIFIYIQILIAALIEYVCLD